MTNTNYISFLKKIGLAFLVYSVCRLLFYVFNLSQFQGSFPFDAFFFGIRFDYVAISYFFLPFIFFSLLPIPIKEHRFYQLFIKILFHLGNTFGIILNLIDVGYYPFSLRRSTADLFQFLSTGNDLLNLLPNYIKDYWYLFFILIGLIVGTELLYRKCESKTVKIPFTIKSYFKQFIIFIIFISLTIIGFRGGIQLKPLDIINAASYTHPKHIPIILNTPFSIIKTVLNERMPEFHFFDEKELNAIYTPEQTIEGNGNFNSKNVVIIILESFAKEYVGFLNNGKGYTPFLDSLMQESYVFTNAYSSGNRSIESLPSIFSGIPPLMNVPFIISNYSANKIDALPILLKQKGYNTSFYHGGTNGTMGFSGFTASAGIEHYFGKDEYPNSAGDEDGAWGINDEPYLQYFAQQLNQKKEPFFSALFTLSSHHPYSLPKKYINKFSEGILPIHKTIAYTDFALSEFFETAKKSSWFNNTIFVFTADHSSTSSHPFYSTFLGRNAIPIFIYDPTGNLKGIDSNYFQHTDITPTILDLLGIKTSIVSFGNSAFSNHSKHIIGFTSNNYFYAENEYILLFDGENSTGLFQLTTDSLMQNNLLDSTSTSITTDSLANGELMSTFKNNKKERIKKTMEDKLKATIQQFNNRLINNKTSITQDKK